MAFVLLLLVTVLLVAAVIAGFSGAPWVPARQKDVDALLHVLGEIKGKRVVELGCGDGRLVLAAARAGSIVTGYEINPLLYLVAKLRCLPYKNATIKMQNFWLVDLSKMDIVIAFLVPRTMPRITQKVDKELTQGAIFASYVFPIVDRDYSKHTASWYLYSIK